MQYMANSNAIKNVKYIRKHHSAKMKYKNYLLKNKWLIFVKKQRLTTYSLFYLFNSKKNIIFALLNLTTNKKIY